MFAMWPKTTEEFIRETENSYNNLKARAFEMASSDGKLKASLVKQVAEHYASNDSSAKLPGKTKSALLPWLIKYQPPAGETDDESEDEGGGEAGETEGEKGATGDAVEESDDAAEEDAAEEHGRGKRRRA